MSDRFKFQIKTQGGATSTLDVPVNFTFQDIKMAIEKEMGTKEFTWICVKQFTFNEPNPAKQAEIVEHIKKAKILVQLPELLGGSNNLNVILTDSEKELLVKQKGTCDICYNDNVDIISLAPSCSSMKLCVECFLQHIKLNVWQSSSWTCPCPSKHILDIWNIPALSGVGFTLSEKMMYAQVREVMTFVNCRKCDRIYSNPTPATYKRCPVCDIDICGFCGIKWDNDTMKKQNFYCSDKCRFVSHVTYELVVFKFAEAHTIPNRRFCTKCGRLGAYGKKCKWNKCSCGFEFCFYCLKDNSNCPNKDFNVKCVEPVQQTLQELWNCHLNVSKF